MEEIKQACQDYMDFMRSEDYNVDGEGDYKNDIYEIAMNYFQGEKVFDEIRKILMEKE